MSPSSVSLLLRLTYSIEASAAAIGAGTELCRSNYKAFILILNYFRGFRKNPNLSTQRHSNWGFLCESSGRRGDLQKR